MPSTRWTPLALASTLSLFTLACGNDDRSGDAGPSGDSGPTCASHADCDDGVFCNGEELCQPGVDGANALGCVAGASPCLEGQTCDEGAASCRTECGMDPDADGDGVDSIECGGGDCDDTNPAIYPGASEVCDAEGVDEDCDPTTIGNSDRDGDGFINTQCCNGDRCGEDCDDTRRGTNPDVPEVCDGRDNDCDGEVDEELRQEVFVDADRDLHGDPDERTLACPGTIGTSASMLDCDDAEPYVSSPQIEFLDERNNDCDGSIDEMPQAVAWYPDFDGDGFGDPYGEVTMSETVVADHSLLPLDCDDGDPSISPLAEERCNGVDDNCDGVANYVIGINDWEDDDNDGFVDANCPGATGDLDCDDTRSNVSPSGFESCDGQDNDCDGLIDNGCATPTTDIGRLAGRWRLCAGEGDAPVACARTDEDVLVITRDGTSYYRQPGDTACNLETFLASEESIVRRSCGTGYADQTSWNTFLRGEFLTFEHPYFFDETSHYIRIDGIEEPSCDEVDDRTCPDPLPLSRDTPVDGSLAGQYVRCLSPGTTPVERCSSTGSMALSISDTGDLTYYYNDGICGLSTSGLNAETGHLVDEYCVPGYSGRNAYIIHPPNFLEDIYSDSIFVRSEASPPTCSAIEDYRCLD